MSRQVQAVCDRAARVSCRSEKLCKQIIENQVEIHSSTTRPSTANQMSSHFKGTIAVPIEIGAKKYEQTFDGFLIEAASDCLLAFEFLETKKGNGLFSKTNLRITGTHRSLLIKNSFETTKSSSVIRESLKSITTYYDCAWHNPWLESLTSIESRFV